LEGRIAFAFAEMIILTGFSSHPKKLTSRIKRRPSMFKSVYNNLCKSVAAIKHAPHLNYARLIGTYASNLREILSRRKVLLLYYFGKTRGFPMIHASQANKSCKAYVDISQYTYVNQGSSSNFRFCPPPFSLLNNIVNQRGLIDKKSYLSRLQIYIFANSLVQPLLPGILSLENNCFICPDEYSPYYHLTASEQAGKSIILQSRSNHYEIHLPAYSLGPDGTTYLAGTYLSLLRECDRKP
jgi:hypothetical protein